MLQAASQGVSCPEGQFLTSGALPTELRFPDEMFDVVSSSEVLEHVPALQNACMGKSINWKLQNQR
jgi:2-polyprenyl-3-methyl-5-hydroxy-6-metoxy-1,4-benzoquinol methylase